MDHPVGIESHTTERAMQHHYSLGCTKLQEVGGCGEGKMTEYLYKK